jgi:hypothetical protein
MHTAVCSMRAATRQQDGWTLCYILADESAIYVGFRLSWSHQGAVHIDSAAFGSDQNRFIFGSARAAIALSFAKRRSCTSN